MARSTILCLCIGLALLAGTAVEGYGVQHRKLQQAATGAAAGSPTSAAAPYGDYGYGYYDYEECFSVYQLLNNTEGLSLITDALVAVGLAETFDDPFLEATLFAPTDAAMEAAAAALNLTSTELLNSPLLLPIVLYHVVPIPILAEQLGNGTIITTLLDQNLTAIVNETIIAESINGVVAEATITLEATESSADVIGADNLACAAVIHVIDNVFLPQILSVNATGNEVSIMVGNGQGSVQRFLIVYDNQETDVTISAAPAPAPALAAPVLTQSPTGALETFAPTQSIAGTTTSSAGQKTTAGTTYYTNAGLTS